MEKSILTGCSDAEWLINRLYREYCEQRLDSPELVVRRLPDNTWAVGYLNVIGKGETLEDAIVAFDELDLERALGWNDSNY